MARKYTGGRLEYHPATTPQKRFDGDDGLGSGAPDLGTHVLQLGPDVVEAHGNSINGLYVNIGPNQNKGSYGEKPDNQNKKATFSCGNSQPGDIAP